MLWLSLLWLSQFYNLPIETSCWSRGQKHALLVVDTLFNSLPATLILLENPELHLDQLAQFSVGGQIALCADGNQIIVETHSEHILNGIRLAVKDKDIKAADVSIQFFGDDHSISSLTICEDGSIEQPWPEGFFDQYEKELGLLP